MRDQERIETTTYVRVSARPRFRALLSPREVYVLRAAPVHGLSNRGHTLWLVRDEDLSLVVEGLLQRGLLALRGDVGRPCAELTEAGRAALSGSRAGAAAP